MSRELIYTAADKGIDGLRGCLCYAGASIDALSNKLLLQNLLAINNYQELYKAGNPKAHSNPIGFSHYRINSGAKDVSVISRIGPAPLYANRTNFIAHHVILEDNEKAKAGPAWTIKSFEFRDMWSQATGWFKNQPIALGNLEPKVCNYWKTTVGDAGWAGWLAERAQTGKHTFVLYPATLDPLILIQETISLLPEHQRWNITFSTYYTLGGRGPNCNLRFIPLEADTFAVPFSDKTFHDGVLNLTRDLGKAPTGALASLARGEKPLDIEAPKWLTPASQAPLISDINLIKSDIPLLTSNKDPLYSKSELFIDQETDNTWKTLKFVGGIFGLLFLLVLPSLFVWLITTAINKAKIESEKQINVTMIGGLIKENEKLAEDKNKEKKDLDKAEGDLTKKLNDKKTKESETKRIDDSLKENNIINVKDSNDLYAKFDGKKFKEGALVKMPKQVIEELLDGREKSKNIILSKSQKGLDEKSFEEFLNNNKDKVLDDGSLILNFLIAYEKTLSAQFAKSDKVRKYFETKAWLDADKLSLEDVKFVEILKKDYTSKFASNNDDAYLFPVELLIICNILLFKKSENLVLYGEFTENLKLLRELLFDGQSNYLDEKKFKDYLGMNPSNKTRLSSLVFPETTKKNNLGNINLPMSKVEIRSKDWEVFVQDFAKYRMKMNIVTNPEDPVTMIKHLKDFTKIQIDALVSVKGVTK